MNSDHSSRAWAGFTPSRAGSHQDHDHGSPAASADTITSLSPGRRSRATTTAQSQNKTLLNHVLYYVMVTTTFVSWLLPEMKKAKVIASDWIPFGFNSAWIASALVLAICNLSQGRRFHLRHIGAISLTAFFSAVAAPDPSFLLMQTAVLIGIFFGDYSEEYYPDDAPPADDHLLPHPVMTPTRQRPAYRPGRARVDEGLS